MTSELEERRLDVADLRIGMFVCRLDRPWEQTPFPLQGVELSSELDIGAVREHCRFVYIDARRESANDDHRHMLARTQLSATRFKSGIQYADTAPFEEELPRASAALENASTLIDRIFVDVASGRELSAEHVEMAVRPVVASILRSADAFFWMEGLRRHDSYSYGHALGCSALAAAFGRHMGFAEETIISLAAGGLLMDVGRTQLPEAVLRFNGPLTPNEWEVVRTHVAHGLDILTRSGISDPDVADIVRTHHERYDGSGYPQRLMGTHIPLTGRMLGIVDAYDAMTSARPYRPAISRHQALRQLYAARDGLFQSELVEQFQVCLGVYPTGSLVELNTGEVAIVTAQNQIRRLRPKVTLLSDPDKQPLADFRMVDLLEQGPVPKGARALVEIVRSLPAGAYGFDAAGAVPVSLPRRWPRDACRRCRRHADAESRPDPDGAARARRVEHTGRAAAGGDGGDARPGAASPCVWLRRWRPGRSGRATA